MSTRISSLLVKELRTGVFKDSEKLPAELELSEKLGVSRTVIRDALADLESKGFIERVRGIGTVINREIVNLSNRLDIKCDRDKMILDCGAKPTQDTIKVRAEIADEAMAEQLKLDDDLRVIVCEKRILADGVPVIYVMDYFPMELFDGMDYRDIDWSMPLHEIFETYCGLSVVMDISKIAAVGADERIARKLNIAEGKPILYLDEVGYCKLSRPILHSIEYYTDYFNFTVLRKKL